MLHLSVFDFGIGFVSQNPFLRCLQTMTAGPDEHGLARNAPSNFLEMFCIVVAERDICDGRLHWLVHSNGPGSGAGWFCITEEWMWLIRGAKTELRAGEPTFWLLLSVRERVRKTVWRSWHPEEAALAGPSRIYISGTGILAGALFGGVGGPKPRMPCSPW
jgi:hypothetical protein